MGSLEIPILLTLKQQLYSKPITKQPALVSFWFLPGCIYKLLVSVGSKEILNHNISLGVCLTERILSEGRCWHTVVWCQQKFHCEELHILFKWLLINEKCYLWPGIHENNPAAAFADFLHFPLTTHAATPAASLPSLREAATHTDAAASVQGAHTSPSPSHKPRWSPEIRLWQRLWSKHDTSHVSSTQLRFSALKGIVVNSCYVPSHLYLMTDKPGEDVNILEFKNEKPKYSKICLSLNKTQCASVEKEIIFCLIQKKSFVPITAHCEGMTFFPPLRRQMDAVL